MKTFIKPMTSASAHVPNVFLPRIALRLWKGKGPFGFFSFRAWLKLRLMAGGLSHAGAKTQANALIQSVSKAISDGRVVNEAERKNFGALGAVSLLVSVPIVLSVIVFQPAIVRLLWAGKI